MFEQLKQPLGGKTSPPLFVLGFDEQRRAFLSLQDQDGHPLFEVQPHGYTGPIREVLSYLAQDYDRQRTQCDWDRQRGTCYLADHDQLIPLLAASQCLIRPDGSPLHLAQGRGRLAMQIEGQGQLDCQWVLDHDHRILPFPLPISQRFVLLNQQIYEVYPLAGNLNHWLVFQSKIAEQDVETYLSLLYSQFSGMDLRFRDHALATGPAKHPHAAICFEKVDSDGMLTFRTGLMLEGLPFDFLQDFAPLRRVCINELERVITVHEIIYKEDLPGAAVVARLLNRHKKDIESENGAYFEGDLFMIERGLAQSFLSKELPALVQRFSLLGGQQLGGYGIRATTPGLNIHLEHGLDFLQGTASLDFGGQSLSLADALASHAQQGFVTLADGSRGLLDKNLVDKLLRLLHLKADKVQASLFDLPEIARLVDEPDQLPSFRLAREIFAGLRHCQDLARPLPSLNLTLRPYQERGFRWLLYLYEQRLGGCLADDMGLGKTIQAIALLAAVCPNSKLPSLVIVPKTLLFNWQQELSRFAPQLHIHLAKATSAGMNQQGCVLLATYGQIRKQAEFWAQQPFHCVILDESQHIKNSASQTARAVFQLRAEYRLALSGTPVENHLGELFSLFHFLNPSMFGSFAEFNLRYGRGAAKTEERELMAELRRKIAPFVLRRLKSEVFKELPAKVEQIRYLDMSREQARFYTERRAFYKAQVGSQIRRQGMARSKLFILQALSELRQIASIPEVRSDDEIRSPKRAVLQEQAVEAAANGHKMLIFANYLGAVERIAADLESAGLQFLVMTGATRDRQTLVSRFQDDPTIHVLLMTLKTGGLGLNLTAADCVFIFDPWWNRAAENQACDRAHRIGQVNTVFTYRLITRGTIEEKILALQERKQTLFEDLLGGDGAVLASLTAQDLDELFSGAEDV